MRIRSLTMVVALLLASALALVDARPAAAAEACFPQTNHCVRGRFLDQWQNFGGLAINGYPLTDERMETLEDGKPYLVQWFERVRMEYHPENAPPNDVLLGQFGRILHPADPPVAQQAGMTYFNVTGHNVNATFMAYWQANGGLPQFGYPLSELLSETLEDGKAYQVQYFERARFELHPENQPPFNVLLGQFGRRILAVKESAGTVIFQDDFSNPASGWSQRESSGGSLAYASGGYRMTLKQPGIFIVGVNPKLANLTDVQVEVDAAKFFGPDDNDFGIMCRGTDIDNLYELVITSQGDYGIFKRKGGNWQSLTAGGPSPAIRQGNASNRVRADCVGSTLALYANGQKLAEAQDTDFRGGDVGLTVGSYKTPGVVILFDNFVARKP